jgi:hypothetical protein
MFREKNDLYERSLSREIKITLVISYNGLRGSFNNCHVYVVNL